MYETMCNAAITSTAPPKILLTGSTGYIGGTILSQLLASTTPPLSNAVITCLIRGADRIDKLTAAYGPRVNPVVYKDLDDLSTTTAVAAQHDVVINTTLGYHSASVQALLRGLSLRKADTGRAVWLIHTSGTSNLADMPISRGYVEKRANREFDDAIDDIYAYEKEREALHPAPQRSTELEVIDMGIELGVNTLVIMSPLIYGLGTGLFHTTSLQIPLYVASVLGHGRAVVVDGGKGVWDHVHVGDVAALYEIAVRDILENGGENLPSGKRGIIFSANGRHEWREVAQRVADACYEAGKIQDKTVESVGMAEGAKILAFAAPFLNEMMVELALCSNARTVASVARKLGWKPSRGDEEWRKGFADDVKTLLEKS